MKESGTQWIAGMAIAASAVIAATTANAQYAPYGPAAQVAAGPQGYAAPPQAAYGQAPPTYGYGAYAPPATQQAPPAYGYPAQRATYPAYTARQGYPAMAQAPTEQLPTPAESGSPVIQNGNNYGGAYPSTNGYPVTGGEQIQPTPAAGYESYPTTGGQYQGDPGHYHSDGTYTGAYGGECSTCGYGYQGGYGGYGYDASAGYGCQDYGVSGYFGGQSCRQCFIGVYGLFMERDDSAKVNTAIVIDNNAVGAYPYYPPNGAMPPVIRLDNSDDVDFDFQGGAEIRFGSTFGAVDTCGCGNGYGACGCGPCCTHQPYAWEVVYWAIAEDDNSSLRTDTIAGNNRMYSMINYQGIEYDRDGAGAVYAYRPVADYYGYPPPIQMPVATDPVPVAFLTRTNFSTQNLELNFLRLPIYGGCGVCGIDCGCGGMSGCEPCADCFQPVCSVTGLCGVRYMRFDDDFFNAVQFANPTVPDPDYDGFYVGMPETELFHEINVDNHLTGFQVGANVDYMCTSCWSLFAYSNFGVFNNHMKHYQRVFENGAGEIRFVNDGSAVSVRSSKDDIAFLGELRVGAAYQVSCNCRITAAWRAVAISGAALSVNQIHPFYNYESVARIDSQGSLILHGLQVGSEFKF